MPLKRTLASLATVFLLSAPVSLFAAGPALTAAFRPDDPAQWREEGGHVFAEPAGGKPATAVFTVPAGAAGFYAITDSRIRRDTATAGRIELGLRVRPAGVRPGQPPPPAVLTALAAGELFDFDAFLGYLAEGDTVQLTVGPADDGASGDRTELDCRIATVPFIPVSVLAEDIGQAPAGITPGAWSVSVDVPADSPAARRLAAGRHSGPHPVSSPPSLRVAMPAGSREALVTFAVPQSGYYALHDTRLAAVDGPVEARLFVGMESAARRVLHLVPAAAGASLNTDLGYLAKGELVHLALAHGTGAAAVDLSASLIEWAPRRAPLRVRRGTDGYLDVFEPAAPRLAVDIPADRWITVPASAGDATEALRKAFADAAARAKDGRYAGVRLESGRTYAVASQQAKGRVFDLRGLDRVVFDGNGATLHIGSAELAREELQLFHLTNCRNLAFADFTATGAEIPFTTGQILDVSPRGEKEMTQTVTFRVDPGELDPLKDIARNGRSNAYAYDPKIPGRLGLGTWTHYPTSGNPSIKATGEPGVFTHTVTRTNDSIEPGMKWLIKNKNAGVIYLETRGATENITLTGVDGRAAGGGQLRFWQTSGINILDCRFEPEGDNWISSSADGVHGRGREGVWIENTLIRGVCEDIMNTYGQNMVVEADAEANDAVMSIRMFERSSGSTSGRALRMPTDENVAAGDQLVFFNPKSGRVLGYAGVVAIKEGRFTLTNPVPDVDSWEEADGKNATMVYNTRVAGRFFVRDSRLMDSMRVGIYIKARGGVIFGTQFEGLSAPAILGMNEPEWPEGPPPTHVWVQGCTFSQNNYGYMPRNRDYIVADPADISVYTRHFRDPAVPDDFQAFVTHDQYANSHMKFIGNVFHDWRGMGVSVRNAHNVRIEDNLFLAPVNDEVMRTTLAADPVLNVAGRGTYAAIHLDSVGGARVAGNRFHGLPAGDRPLAQGGDVTGLVAENNAAVPTAGLIPGVSLSFGEWSGQTSDEATGFGTAVDTVALGGAMHRAGRLGAGLHFSGGAPAVLAASGDVGNLSFVQFGLALWACPDSPAAGEQVLYAQGGAAQGVVIALRDGRWVAGVWRGPQAAWLDLGPVEPARWQHVGLVFDGMAGVLTGFINGAEVARTTGMKFNLEARAVGASFGGLAGPARLGPDRDLAAGAAPYVGALDEFRLFGALPGAGDMAALALCRPAP